VARPFPRKSINLAGSKYRAIANTSLSKLLTANTEEDGEYEEDDEENTELYKLSDEDEPSWVMVTTAKTVQQRVESFRQKYF